MSKKDLVIKSDELGNLIFDKETVEILEKFKKDMNVLGRILKYGKEVTKKKDHFGKIKLCQKINLKPSECEFIKIDSLDLIDLSWITTQILDNEKDVQHLFNRNQKKYFNGSKFKNIEEYQCSLDLKINKTVFTDKPQSLVIRKKYLLLPQLIVDDYSNFSKYFLWIVCKKEDKEDVYNEVQNLFKKYQILKNQICHIDEGSLSIVSEKCKFNINQIAMTEDFEKEVNLIIKFAKNFETFQDKKIKIKRGIMIHGAPGTGKTISVKALVDEFKKNGGTIFYYFKSSGVFAGNDYSISDVYKMANDCAPSLVILEDFDLIAASRSLDDRKTSAEHISNELLKILEDSKDSENVITVATTNLLRGIDEAAIRHGRIDRVHFFDYPTLKLKEKILKEHLKLYNVNLNYESVRNRLKHVLESEITGATIMSVVRSAVQFSVSEMREIKLTDFEFASRHIKLSKINNTIL